MVASAAARPGSMTEAPRGRAAFRRPSWRIADDVARVARSSRPRDRPQRPRNQWTGRSRHHPAERQGDRAAMGGCLPARLRPHRDVPARHRGRAACRLGTFPQRPIEMLYAGCGLFAPFALMLSDEIKPGANARDAPGREPSVARMRAGLVRLDWRTLCGNTCAPMPRPMFAARSCLAHLQVHASRSARAAGRAGCGAIQPGNVQMSFAGDILVAGAGGG